MELLVCKDIEFPSSPLAWFWARALNLASIFGGDVESSPGNAPTSPSFWAGGIGFTDFRSNNKDSKVDRK